MAVRTVGSVLDKSPEKVSLLTPNLECLRAYDVRVLAKLESELLNSLNNTEQRLQFLALMVHLHDDNMNTSSAVSKKQNGNFELSAVLVASKSIALAFSLFRMLLRLRSQKVQQILSKWGMVLYFSLFRIRGIYKGIIS